MTIHHVLPDVPPLDDEPDPHEVALDISAIAAAMTIGVIIVLMIGGAVGWHLHGWLG